MGDWLLSVTGVLHVIYGLARLLIAGPPMWRCGNFVISVAMGAMLTNYACRRSVVTGKYALVTWALGTIVYLILGCAFLLQDNYWEIYYPVYACCPVPSKVQVGFTYFVFLLLTIAMLAFIFKTTSEDKGVVALSGGLVQ